MVGNARTPANRARRAAEQQHGTDKARIAELERDNARLVKAAPVTAATIAAPAVRPAAQPAYTPGEKRGWFDWGARTTHP